MKFKKIMVEYWLKHYIDPATKLCCLCGNTGEIKLNNVLSPRGNKLKDTQVFCICPNGRAMRGE